MDDPTTDSTTSFLAELTADQLEALARGEIVTTIEAVEPSQEFPGFEAGTTAADVAAALSEEADALEAGESSDTAASALQFALAHDPAFKRRHDRACEERHRCRVAGLPQPDLPQPPRWAAESGRRQRDALREFHLSRAATLRSEARSLGCARRAPERKPRPRGAGRPKVSSPRRSSERSGDSGSDSESSEPALRRLCENKRCEADTSHRPKLARYCDDACQQQALRDRRTVELLDEIAGTPAEGLSCVCVPRRGDTEPHRLVEHGHCWKCGYTRGVVTRRWVTDPAVSARSFVLTPARPDTWKVGPDREMSAKLRRTRGRWDKPAAREEAAA